MLITVWVIESLMLKVPVLWSGLVFELLHESGCVSSFLRILVSLPVNRGLYFSVIVLVRVSAVSILTMDKDLGKRWCHLVIRGLQRVGENQPGPGTMCGTC